MSLLSAFNRTPTAAVCANLHEFKTFAPFFYGNGHNKEIRMNRNKYERIKMIERKMLRAHEKET